jgi:hypothetical protein
MATVDYATIVTAPGFNDEGNPKITYTNPKGNSVTALEVGIFNETGSQSYAPYRAVSKTGTSYTFNLTDTERNNLRRAAKDSETITISFYIKTTINGKVYRKGVQRGFAVVNANPIIDAVVIDTNPKTYALTNNENTLIKGYSNALATMEVTPQKYATIAEDFYIIRDAGGKTHYGTSYTFENTEYKYFTFSAEDSRGFIGSKIVELDMIEYIPITCNAVFNRPDAVGNMTIICRGNYFNGSFGAVDNTLTLQYRYTLSDDWKDMSVELDGNSYFATANFKIDDYDRTLAYSFEVKAVDKLETATSESGAVRSVPLCHWGEDDFVFEVPVKFNRGATGVTIDVPEIEWGVWEPTLDANAISYYTTQSGYYQKVGQVVTVGFYIKAQCNSGYTTTKVIMSGLPFTPLLPTAGGGLCSGAYVSANCNFQCYVAENDGTITTRIQRSNNTTDTTLLTSKGGCGYRDGGGEITLSGTITYATSN